MSKTINLGPVSAYALAKKHGFEGTEAEWLKSLGAHIGENGCWWVGDKDTGVLADPAELSKLTQQAQTAQTAAEGAAGAAAENAEAAQQAANNANHAADAAAASASAAKTAQEAAAKSASAAVGSATAAQTSAETASKSAADAADSAAAAQAAQTAAEEAQTKADADATATAEARRIVESAADAEQGRVEAEAARVAADAARTEAITTIADGLSALQARENVLTGSASGTVVSVEDAAAAPLCGLHIYGKSVQDGTPSPDNPVPIESIGDSGTITVKVTGKNLLDYQKCLCASVNDEGATYPSEFRLLSDYIPVTNGIYTLHGYKKLNFIGFIIYDKNLNFVKRSLLDDVSGETARALESGYVRLYFSHADNSQIISATDLNTVQFELGATATAFEPYHEQLLTLSTPGGLPGIPVNADGTYTDADGQQWVCDEVDLSRGVYVQRIGRINVAEMTWHYEKTPSNNNDILMAQMLSEGKERGDTLCQYAKFEGVAYDIEQENPLRVYVWKNTAALSFKPACGIDTLDKFVAWLEDRKDATISYVLVKPIERPLTDEEIAAYKALTTYAPNTVVQAEGAQLMLDYQRDVNIVIKNLEDAIASITTQ